MKEFSTIAAAGAAAGMLLLTSGAVLAAPASLSEQCANMSGEYDADAKTCTVTSTTWGDVYPAGKSGNLVQDYTSSTLVYVVNPSGKNFHGDPDAELSTSDSGTELCFHHKHGDTNNCE